MNLKIKSIKRKEVKIPVYDIETPCHNYILGNGLISHNTMDQYNPLGIGGGKGLRFACSSIVLATSRAREKDGDDITGVIVSARTDKSRYAVEFSKLKYHIRHDGGIHPVMGIEDDLIDFGFIVKPSNGWYMRNFPMLGMEGEDRKWRMKEIFENWKEFFKPILSNVDVKEAFERKYSFKYNNIISHNIDDLEEDNFESEIEPDLEGGLINHFDATI